MKIEIETDGIDSGKELHHVTRCCAGYELGTFRTRVSRVRIVVSGKPYSNGNRKTSCEVRVDFFASDSIFTRATDLNPYVAIHWALERAGSVIAHRLQGEPIDDYLADPSPVTHSDLNGRDNANSSARVVA